MSEVGLLQMMANLESSQASKSLQTISTTSQSNPESLASPETADLEVVEDKSLSSVIWNLPSVPSPTAQKSLRHETSPQGSATSTPTVENKSPINLGNPTLPTGIDEQKMRSPDEDKSRTPLPPVNPAEIRLPDSPKSESHPNIRVSGGFFKATKHVAKMVLYNLFRLIESIVYHWLPLKFFLVGYLTLRYHKQIQNFIDVFALQDPWVIAFELLFLFKYVKVVVHTISFLVYRPVPIPEPDRAIVKPDDCTVLIPTIGAVDEDEFRGTLRSIFVNKPAQVIVITARKDEEDVQKKVFEELKSAKDEDKELKTIILTLAVEDGSRRKQIIAGITKVETSITILADDNISWGPNYLRAAIAPFDDPRIGGVGTNKRVRRLPFALNWKSFVNFIACTDLERQNFEFTASITADQAIPVISGGTALYRTAVLKHPDFEEAYLQETWFFGLLRKSGIDVGDDNFLIRFTTGTAKYNVWFQNSIDTIVHTTADDTKRICSRSTWRSNSTSLLSDQAPWKTQPWSVYAIHISRFINFALFYDLALGVTFYYALAHINTSKHMVPFQLDCVGKKVNIHCLTPRKDCTLNVDWPGSIDNYCNESFGWIYGPLHLDIDKKTAIAVLLSIEIVSKLIKPFPHFWRNPKDLLFIPGYFLFGRYRSFIKP